MTLLRAWQNAALVLCIPHALLGQFEEVHLGVGSERELYIRTWSLISSSRLPPTHARIALADSVFNAGPWVGRDRRGVFLPPSIAVAFNSAYPWQIAEGWQGRGFSGAASGGGHVRWRSISLRAEPTLYFSDNGAFKLEGSTGFADAMRPGTIDLPQRFGDRNFLLVDPGESHAYLELIGIRSGFSTERIFWGPGVRHSLIFSSGGARFPRLFAEMARPLSSPAGTFYGQVIYGRLDQSAFAPSSASVARLGTGFMGWWRSASENLSLGGARFYHREWPDTFRTEHLLAPFGSFFFDDQIFGNGIPDNQLASAFINVRFKSAALEFFAEFGRTDRSVDIRDLAVEPEHNSAFLFGFLKGFRTSTKSFWSTRLEVASGRISAIQRIGRSQGTFFEHGTISQGHTQLGMLLGTPLIDRGGGAEIAVDRWTQNGRWGVQLKQRQMPPTIAVTQLSGRSRTQWDARLSGLRFIGRSEASWQAGSVVDLNRFPGQDVTSLYFSIGWRFGW